MSLWFSALVLVKYWQILKAIKSILYMEQEPRTHEQGAQTRRCTVIMWQGIQQCVGDGDVFKLGKFPSCSTLSSTVVGMGYVYQKNT